MCVFKKFFSVLTISLVPLGLSLNVCQAQAQSQSQSGNVKSFVQNMVKEAMQVITDKNKSRAQRLPAFKTIINQYFDVTGIGDYLGGMALKQATPEEQSTYRKLVLDHMVQIYLDKFEQYKGGTYEDDHLDIGRVDEKSPGVWIVKTTLKNIDGAGKTLCLIWHLQSNGSSIKVTDVTAENISMRGTKRKDFQSIIKSKGFHTFLTELERLVTTNSQA